MNKEERKEAEEPSCAHMTADQYREEFEREVGIKPNIPTGSMYIPWLESKLSALEQEREELRGHMFRKTAEVQRKTKGDFSAGWTECYVFFASLTGKE